MGGLPGFPRGPHGASGLGRVDVENNRGEGKEEDEGKGREGEKNAWGP